MLKFFMTPGSCSTGIHILLEEADELFQVHLVDLLRGDQQKSDYAAINPKQTIPCLVTSEGQVLSEFVSIAWWLGQRYPKQGWIPSTPGEQAKVLDVLSYVVNSIHLQGYTRIFTPEKYQFQRLEESLVKQAGEDIVNRGLTLVSQQLHASGYVSEQFGIADVALFYCEFWASNIELKLPEPCKQHLQMLLHRPKVKAVLMEEGYGNWLQRELNHATT